MTKFIEPVLYRDDQQQVSCLCPVCGGCCYPPTFRCLLCERREKL